jgi:glycine/serine hydroxymethyltransferase
LGSPALTTRGLGKKEFKEIAEIIHFDLLDVHGDRLKSKERVKIFTDKFPLSQFPTKQL